MQLLNIDKKKMVGETGIEPATSWSRTKRATKLRYSPTRSILLIIQIFTKYITLNFTPNF